MLPIIIAAKAKERGFDLRSAGFPFDRRGRIALVCAGLFLVIAGVIVLVIG